MTAEQQERCESHVDWARALALKDCRRARRMDQFDEAFEVALLALAGAAAQATFDPDRSKFSTYSTKCITAALCRWRMAMAAERAGPILSEAELADARPDPSEAPSLLADHLRSLLSLLPAEQRLALSLRWGLTPGAASGRGRHPARFAEVGALMGLSAREARARHDEGLAQLRRLAGIEQEQEEGRQKTEAA